MTKYALALVVSLALATSAFAAPGLGYTMTDLGNGLTAYDVTLTGLTGGGAGYVTMSFWVNGGNVPANPALGTSINQIAYVVIPGVLTYEVNDETMKAALGANAVNDSWVYGGPNQNPKLWGGNAGPGVSYVPGREGTAIDQFAQAVQYAPGYFYEFSVGSGALSNVVEGQLLAHIVANGAVAYKGVISHGTYVQSPTQGIMPEPATMALLGLGVVGLIRRR